jgi:hypothetical protein
MPETCPVCDRPVEHVRIEGADDSDGVASFDVGDLCAVADERRWDRICTVAAPDGGGSDPALEIYYHFFDDG